ncbi:MAG: hypothetical protein SGJ20_04605, partial [Planctomycetota bacterium]|nr:hypothetical protein [Planctomycetota bacterium]
MNQIALTRVMILTTDHIVRIVVLIIIATRTPSAQVPSKHRGNTVTIWLMPSENAGPPQNVPPNELPLKREDLRKAYKEKNVRILNFEQPLASAEEGSDPIFGMRMFQIVSSQTETLKALESFAALKKSDNLTVAVRFVTWDKAFNLLENLSHTPATPRPDVSQIGTTWSARLESLG